MDNAIVCIANDAGIKPKVRIVAVVRPRLDAEIDSYSGTAEDILSVKKLSSGDSSESVAITIGYQTHSRKEPYRFHSFYKEEDLQHVFAHEVKPLLPQVYQGFNAVVLAYGARGSGKTYMIQGSSQRHGLASLAMDEILSLKPELGSAVSISCYEVHQDRVYDLLEPKKQEVMVLENSEGRIQFKGLSQIPVNSVSEFKRLYVHGGNQRRMVQKHAGDVVRRIHKGLIIHVSYVDKTSGINTEGKITFVDLAGYEDAKRLAIRSPHLAEAARINNKSLYALQNVVYAVNSSENHAPFRESKLTRLLQDSIDGNNQAVMITCLKPILCPDTIYTISLSSRSCHVGCNNIYDSNKNGRNRLMRPVSFSTPSMVKSQNVLNRTAKTSESTPIYSTQKKARDLLPGRGRRPLDLALPVIKESALSSQAGQPGNSIILSSTKNVKRKGTRLTSPSASVVARPQKLAQKPSRKPMASPFHSIQKSVGCIIPSVNAAGRKRLGVRSHVIKEDSSLLPVKMPSNKEEESTSSSRSQVDGPSRQHENISCKNGNILSPITPVKSDISLTVSKDNNIQEENNKSSLVTNKKHSPLISETLREITNMLKSLSTTPGSIHVKHIGTESVCDTQLKGELLEPKTPICARTPNWVTLCNNKLSDLPEPETPAPFCAYTGNLEPTYLGTPREVFQSRSCGLKKSLVKEYLKYLNSATKEELKELQGIGEKRALYIMELRQESPEPFKELEDLKSIGLSAKQISRMMKKNAETLFS